jgi:uncharacterized membrane protein
MNLQLFPLDPLLVFSVAAALAALAALWFAGIRNIFFWLRAAGVLILLFLICQPALVKRSENKRKVVAVAMDLSKSMKLSGRLDSARSFMARQRKDLESGFSVDYYGFSSGSRRIKDPLGRDELFDQGSTDLNRSLWEIRREEGEALSGIILLSDGNHNAEPPGPNWIKELNVPVFAITTETGKKIKDLSIRSLKMGDFAFKNLPFTLTAKINAIGFRGGSVTVNLRRADQLQTILASKTFNSETDNYNIDIDLGFVPDMTGKFSYTVEVVPQKDEATTANNFKRFDLDVLVEKVRVLYLCGQPGPEYAFLRHALKSDPIVELVSFVILRNPENISLVPENDLSLIPFPVNDIFTRDIYQFDALILENFTYRRFGFMPQYITNIKKWVVEKGGGLLMTGGENSFASGGWGGTDLEKILPVALENPSHAFEEGLFKPKITGTDDEILSLNTDKDKNTRLWDSIPELDGCQALGEKPGANALIKHPSKGWVVLACAAAGRGRVVACGANTTWRWALASETPEAYSLFWKNVVRYLTRTGRTKPLNVVFDRTDYNVDDNYNAKLRAVETAQGEEIDAVVKDPDGKSQRLGITKTGPSEWMVQGKFPQKGEYLFSFSLRKNGVSFYREEASRFVTPESLSEELELNVDEELLKKIAADSGGDYFTQEGFDISLMAPRLRKPAVADTNSKTPLWDNKFLLLGLSLLLITEWYLRKRKGLK